MIKTLPDELKEILVKHSVPTYKWINITGFIKSGKTEFCTKLSKEVETLYFDFEKGTKQYLGNFVHIEDYKDFCTKFVILEKAIQEKLLSPKIIVLDPINALAESITRWYMKKEGITNLGDVPYGQGWSDTRDIMINIISKLFKLSELLVTVTHVKLNVLNEGRSNMSFLDMDLPGKTKQWIQATSDAHAIFSRATNEKDESYLNVSFDSSNPNEISFAGSRVKEFYNINNGNDFLNIILKKFY